MGKAEYKELLHYARDDFAAAQYLMTIPERKLEITYYHFQLWNKWHIHSLSPSLFGIPIKLN